MTHSVLFQSLIDLLQQARRANCKAAGRAMPICQGIFGCPAVALSFPPRRQGFSRRPRQEGQPRTLPKISRQVSLLSAPGSPDSMQPTSSKIGAQGRCLRSQGFCRRAHSIEQERRQPRADRRTGGAFINSNHRDLLTLAQEFNLPLFNRAKDAQRFPLPETGYYFDGQNRPESEVAEKLRSLAEQIAKDAALLDEDFDTFAPASTDCL